jgi:hypothetical protein
MGEQPEMREARLRPEFAALYPGVEPGSWQDAAVLADQVLSEHLLRPSPGYIRLHAERPRAGQRALRLSGREFRYPAADCPHASHRSSHLAM